MIKVIISIFLFFTSLAHANTNYIKLLVGFPPGGGQDIIARIFDDNFNRQGLKSLVFNKPGASGIVAFNECEEDPQYLCVTGNGQLVGSVLQPASIRKFNYNNINYIKVVAVTPNVLITNKKNTKSLKEIFEDIKDNKVNFGSGSNGHHHESLKLFKTLNTKQAQSIEYKGNAQVAVDILGEHLHYGIIPYAVVKNNPDIRIVATMKKYNFPEFKDLSSVESFYPGLNAEDPMFGFVTSTKTSQDLKDFYNKIITNAMKDKETQLKFQEQGLFMMDINLTDKDYKRISDNDRDRLMKLNNVK